MSLANVAAYWPTTANDEDVYAPSPRLAKQAASFTELNRMSAGPEDGLTVTLWQISGGFMEATPSADHRVYLHVGNPLSTTCSGYGQTRRRMVQTGDVDVIAAGAGGFWVDERPALSLQMNIAPRLLEQAGRGSGRRLSALELKGPMRDPAIEPIGWALKAELDHNGPNGRLYRDSLALALASRLLVLFGEEIGPGRRPAPLSRRRLARVIDYIEAHLDQELSLERLSDVACLSPSHFKASFRQTTGAPLHQYVVRRRVERAKRLLAEGRLSISEVALEVGFAHHSHLARWTRRLLGVTPKELAA